MYIHIYLYVLRIRGSENEEEEGKLARIKIDPIYQSQITIVKEEKLCHYTLESKYFPSISLSPFHPDDFVFRACVLFFLYHIREGRFGR